MDAARDGPLPALAPLVRVEGLTMAYGDRLIQRDLSFDVRRGEVLAIIGGSGCGKSTLLRHLIGLLQPAAGFVRYVDPDGSAYDLADASPAMEALLRRRFGVMFQAGALWSSMTVGENVMLPLELFGPKRSRGARRAEREGGAQRTEREGGAQRTEREGAAQRAERARACLAMVGLAPQFDAEPASLSGGQRKRASIARALALDPPLLYLDEPSAGLDPITSAQLDELIISLRDAHQRSVVLVSHELESIFAVADRALFLDAERKTMTALDAPQVLLESGPPEVQRFLKRTLPATRREEVAA